MKNSLVLFVLTILFSSCATTNKMSNEAIHYAIVGQNERIVYKRLGVPARTSPNPDGGKILIYEYQSKGMFTTPNKSKITFDYSGDMNDLDPHTNLQFSSVNTETNDPKYTIYETDVSYLKVFLNKQGNCDKIDHNLSKEQLEFYYKRFKQYIPKD